MYNARKRTYIHTYIYKTCTKMKFTSCSPSSFPKKSRF